MTDNVRKVIPDPKSLSPADMPWARAVTEFIRSQTATNQQMDRTLVNINKQQVNVFTAVEQQAESITRVQEDTGTVPEMPLGVPTAPTLESSLALILVTWDGEYELDEFPSDPIPDPQHIGFMTAEVSLVEPPPGPPYEEGEEPEEEPEDPFFRAGTPFRVGSTTIVASDIGASVGDTVWVRLRPYKTNGEAGTAGEWTTVVVEGVASADIDSAVTDAIDGAVQDSADALTAANLALSTVEGSVVSIITEYAVNDSDTVPPTTGWSTSMPPRTPGTYIWARTTVTYADDTVEVSDPIVAAGASGEQGPPGPPGEDGEPGAPGAPGEDGVGVDSITPYYLLQGEGNPAPPAPTANPPGGGWQLIEPAYVNGTELYRTELVLYTDATFEYTAVSKVSSYTASTQAIHVANLAQAAAEGMVKASATDPGHQVGRIWLVLNGAGETIGIRVSNGTSWESYMIVADQLLVPSSVGATLIANGAITTPKVAAGAITADKVTIADFTNYFPDRYLELGVATWGPGPIVTDLDPPAGGNAILWSGGGSGNAPQQPRIQSEPGDEFVVEYTAKVIDGAVANMGLWELHQVSHDVIADLGDGWFRKRYVGRVVTPREGGERLVYSKSNPGESAFTDIVVRRRVGGELIVDGAVTARTIAAEAVTADKIEAGSISVNHVTPSFGADITLQGNVNIVALSEQQDAQANQIADTQADIADVAGTAGDALTAASNAHALAEQADAAAEGAQNAADAANTQLVGVTTWYRFGADYASIGKSNSTSELRLSNTKISMIESGVEASYWQGGRMVVPKIDVEEQINLGNHVIEPLGPGLGTVMKAV